MSEPSKSGLKVVFKLGSGGQEKKWAVSQPKNEGGAPLIIHIPRHIYLRELRSMQLEDSRKRLHSGMMETDEDSDSDDTHKKRKKDSNYKTPLSLNKSKPKLKSQPSSPPPPVAASTPPPPPPSPLPPVQTISTFDKVVSQLIKQLIRFTFPVPNLLTFCENGYVQIFSRPSDG
eukprot:TRINITY_DN461_c0_g2_i5.p1 TRINITY_DN461_c0_g2~~TRINITY_DN461_c0_g2_i5.p1  ORF type:complete len:174 (+),score=41.19 TRINITY_DN461_c0_g2_i5:58-579(+)